MQLNFTRNFGMFSSDQYRDFNVAQIILISPDRWEKVPDDVKKKYIQIGTLPGDLPDSRLNNMAVILSFSMYHEGIPAQWQFLSDIVIKLQWKLYKNVETEELVLNWNFNKVIRSKFPEYCYPVNLIGVMKFLLDRITGDKKHEEMSELISILNVMISKNIDKFKVGLK